MSGTDSHHQPSRCPVLTWRCPVLTYECLVLTSRMLLPGASLEEASLSQRVSWYAIGPTTSYEMPSTDTAYPGMLSAYAPPTRSPVLTQHLLLSPYAIPGTK
eukprot:102895-Rhodomonas_salina.3